jgi:hypothetical protein
LSSETFISLLDHIPENEGTRIQTYDRELQRLE